MARFDIDKTEQLTMNGLKDFRLSFGSEKYDNNNKDSNFSTSEFFFQRHSDLLRFKCT